MAHGKQKKVGIVDQAVRSHEEDFFQISKYTEGLSQFILQCETPMTIAIQGDWGSGKTSFMNLIDNILHAGEGKEAVETIWFNTWAFSQFNMGDMLPVNLLVTLISTVEVDAGEKETAGSKQMLLRLAKTAALFASDVALNCLGSEIRVSDFLDKNEETGEASLIDTIKNLRSHFETNVQEFLKRKKKSKLVIFIDDLDRLPPERAVEVLEILKLFLECRDCVFVLAIDYMVVCRGIRKKYGEDMDSKKGRSFFDKIIQLPFQMPVEHYNISTFLKNSSMISEEDAYLRQYADLIADSVGANPRAIKRLLNAFQLQKNINCKSADLDDPQERLLLFGVLCMQLSYEGWYQKLVENAQETYNADFFNRLRENVDEVSDEFAEEDAMLPSFMSTFSGILSSKEGSEIRQADVERLYRLLKMAGTTASSMEQKNVLYETEEDLETTKTISHTDISYKICTFGAAFHIGFGIPVQLKLGENVYSCKTHKKTKGRVDGLTAFYTAEKQIKEGDRFLAKYIHADHLILLQPIQ